ncbi:MAG: ABC transporter ATP-binding protein [bacterium]|nr:ABC transporter ATP-binding protein [bacterium]
MEKLLEIKNLYKKFPKSKDFLGKTNGYVYALNGINLDIYKGETLGIVGESGCGKSTLGRCILRLIEADKGDVIFEDKNIFSLKSDELKKIRKDIQIVFQNPYSSLNPRMKIKDILSEPLKLNTNLSSSEIDKKVEAALELVGLPISAKNNMPHEFSGGQRQRIVISRALILNPKFVVADEPISALDISIQAQILSLLSELKERFNLTYAFISHDLRTVKNFCDRVAVMYLGEIAEIAPAKELFENPKHPYTQALLKSIPKIDLNNKEEIQAMKGEPQTNEKEITGCKFAARCPYVTDTCKTQNPNETKIQDGHLVKCFLYN